MRELVYYVAVSLDGRIAGPDRDFSAFPSEGDHLDMILREYCDALPAFALEAAGLTADLSRFDTVLMGWDTYAAGFPFGVRDPYPHLRQHVFSRADREVATGITLGDDPVAVVRRLKAEQGGSGIYLCGGGQLASSLIDEIDRLVLKVNPVVMGDGRPVFAHGYDPKVFHLDASTSYRSGVVVNEYARR